MTSAKREPEMWVWGLFPQWNPEAKPLIRESGGFTPEAGEFLANETPSSQ